MKRSHVLFVLIVVSIFSMGSRVSADEEPLTGEELNRELGLLRNNLRAMSDLIAGLEGKSEAPPLPSVPLELPDGPVGRESFQKWLDRVKADLFRDYHRLNALGNAPKPPIAPGEEMRVIRWTARGAESSQQVELSSVEDWRNIDVAIRNRGKTVVVNPRLVVNGKGNWYSTAAILDAVLSDGMSDRDKAEAIWKFLRDNRYHYEPPHGAGENHDPVKFLNVYGYGFCDDSSSNFTALAQAAGFRGRIWGLSGHVVPEVWYGGGWHMLDPDGKAYYCYPDESTVASVADIVAHPEILSQPADQYYGVDMLTRIYTSTEDNSIHDWYLTTLSTEHTLGITLRPGESLVRSWGNRGLYYCGYRYDEPPAYGNGKIIFEPRLNGELYKIGAAEARNLKAVTGGIAPADAREIAHLTYRFDSPYPLLDGEVRLKYRTTGPGAEVVLTAGSGDDMREVGRAAPPDAGAWEVVFPLDGCFVNGCGEPTYGISIGLELTGGAPVVIEALCYDLDFQCAPAALPALKTGSNRAVFRSDSREARDIEIEHRLAFAGEERR